MIYFEPQEDEEQPKQEPSQRNQDEPLIFFQDFDRPDQAQQQQLHEQSEIAVHQYRAETSSVEIEDTSEQAPQRQSQEEQEETPQSFKQLSVSLLEQLLSKEDRRPLLYTPIPKSVKFQFRIARKKGILESRYGCFIQGGHFDDLIMVAYKESIISKTLFTIKTKANDDRKHQPIAVGSICRHGDVYDFIDDGTFLINGKQILRIMGAARITKSLTAKDITVLTPSITNNQITPIQANSLSDLFELNTINSFSNKFISYEGLNSQHPLTKAMRKRLDFLQSPNNLILQTEENKKEDVKLVLGKASQNEFKMALGHGISPFQAFCIVVAWLDR